MRQIQRRRMKLSRTTVRVLSGERLAHANGGFLKTDFYQCGGHTELCDVQESYDCDQPPDNGSLDRC